MSLYDDEVVRKHIQQHAIERYGDYRVSTAERELREKIAAEIEAQPARYRAPGRDPDSYSSYYEGWDDAMDAAARIIRREVA